MRELLKKTFLKKGVDYYRYAKSDFARFERTFHKDTKKISRDVFKWADGAVRDKEAFESESAYLESEDPIVTTSYRLRKSLEAEFHNKYKDTSLRILVQLPDINRSPGGYSLFINMIESLEFMGFPVKGFPWGDDTGRVLDSFKPNVLLSSDSEKWLRHIDWDAVKSYRGKNELKLGLTASLEEEYNTPLEPRLDKNARERGVDFYYFYDSPEYRDERRAAYQPFFDRGYNIFTYEYTLNPLKYYPVPGLKRDINYIMIGSGYRHRSKMAVYREWLSGIMPDYSGALYGPGWRGIPYRGINNERDRYLYSRGKVGLNLSIPRQMKWSSVLNERTFMLAACGIPQLTDRPLLLGKRFTDDEVFVADTVKEYEEQFRYILDNPLEGEKRALKSMTRVYREHTNFHRCESFFSEVEGLFS